VLRKVYRSKHKHAATGDKQRQSDHDPEDCRFVEPSTQGSSINRTTRVEPELLSDLNLQKNEDRFNASRQPDGTGISVSKISFAIPDRHVVRI
jgi:hypothetical protein